MDGAAGSVEKFEETLDWIAMRMENLESQLSLYSAAIENQANIVNKNKLLDDVITLNKDIWANASAGAEYYANYAEKFLKGLDPTLAENARNGAIAISEFTKEQDEATIEAIQNYRTYAQKAKDFQTKAEQAITEVRNAVIQKIDNIKSYGDAKVTVEDLQTDKLQSRVDYQELSGLIPSAAYYGVNGGNADDSTGMFENSYKKIEYWTPLLQDAIAELNKGVQAGDITEGSTEWYEQVAKIYEIDAAIFAAKTELEEYQNAINDLHWENFDHLISQYEALETETNNLIDLMSNDKMLLDPAKQTYANGTTEFWTADDVKWSQEGLATLGLYAQQMEIAQAKANEYDKAMQQLTVDYNAGKYSEKEYIEKLNELKDGQYDAIKSYKASEKAIADLNKTRIDSIKNGIQKEIEAYEELIQAKKDELSAEKDIYDFQKNVRDQSKSIADIQRKLASVSVAAAQGDLSALAQQKKLQAELVEAQAQLEDTYYNRSIDQQQQALDKELEDFQEEKNKEIEQWDLYMEQVETVVKDSLSIVQAHATDIAETLTTKANEYNMTVSSAILDPWNAGADAIANYESKFGEAASATTDQLEDIFTYWQQIIDKMDEAAEKDLSNINAENETFAPLKGQSAISSGSGSNGGSSGDSSSGDSNGAPPQLTKGSYVEVKPDTKWYANSYGGGTWGRARSGKILYVNEKGSHPYNIEGLGWVRKQDIVGYAKGTTGVNKDQLAWIDEMGLEELVIRPQNGRLTYMEKGTGVVPADLTANLMKWGAIDPQDMLDRNRPSIGVSPSVTNNTTEINIDASVGTLMHVDTLNGDDPDKVLKIVNQALEMHTKNLNNAIRRYTR